MLPSLPTCLPQETCLRRGLCPVSVPHQQRTTILSHSIYYEQHGVPGTDPIKGAEHKIVFIMGLNSSCFSWGPQVRHFGGGGGGTATTLLVFDNRGVGNSGYPRGPYSTSAMAEDVICLLDHLGWTEDRELNVVGISLGGMIAQELAYRIPHRICSLVLGVTKAGGFPLFNFPPWKGLSSLVRITFTTDNQKRAALALEMLFPENWLAETAENGKGRTNFQVQKECLIFRLSVVKPQLILGNLYQSFAAITHNVSAQRLAYIAANVPKIAIVTGDEDHLVHPSSSVNIKAAMDGAIDHADERDAKRVELLIWKGSGHAIHLQNEAQFNQLIERCAKEGRALVKNGWR